MCEDRPFIFVIRYVSFDEWVDYMDPSNKKMLDDIRGKVLDYGISAVVLDNLYPVSNQQTLFYKSIWFIDFNQDN